MKGMDYFHDSSLTPDVTNLIFKFRTRMFHVRNNFRNNYNKNDLLCPLCKMEEDTQEHLFKCEFIKSKYNNKNNDNVYEQVKYDDIFASETSTLLNVGIFLKKIVQIRKDLEEMD